MSKNPKDAKPAADAASKAPPAAANQKADAKGTPAPAGKQPPAPAGKQTAPQTPQAQGKDQGGKKESTKAPVSFQKPPDSPKIDPMKEERKRQKKLAMKMQNEYFDGLLQQFKDEDPIILKDGQKSVGKVDKKNIKKLELGIQQIEGIIHRKGNMIEEDQVDSQLLESFKIYIQFFCYVSLPLAGAKKPSIVEEAVIEKRLSEVRKQRDEVEKKLLAAEKQIKILQSQRIDNPRSAYSHPGLMAYLEMQESLKKKEATVFVKKIKEDKKQFDEKIKKIEDQVHARQIQEDQDKLAKEARLKIQKEKEKEENLKNRIREIEQDKAKRQQDFEEHQEKYKQQTEKMNNGKSPLYMRLNQQFNSQQKANEEMKQKTMNDARESHKRIDQMNLFEHQQKYLEKLKVQEDERLQDIKRHKEESKEQLLKIQSFPQSTMWNQAKEDITYNSPTDAKQRALKIVEARNVFAEGVKNKKKVHVDKDKQLELLIRLDKMQNPAKYIKQLRRRNSAESQNKSEDYDKFDEKVFKKEIKIDRQSNTQMQKGLEYLEEVKEAAKKMPKKANSEQPLNDVNKTVDNLSDVKNGSIMSSVTQSRPKIDYLQEMRTKFSLDKKSSGLKDWERVSRSQNGLDPVEKKNNLLRISKKLDDEARHQEIMFNINKGDRNGKFTVQDVENREKIDEMYLESIKAKLAIFDSVNVEESQSNYEQSRQAQ